MINFRVRDREVVKRSFCSTLWMDGQTVIDPSGGWCLKSVCVGGILQHTVTGNPQEMHANAGKQLLMKNRQTVQTVSTEIIVKRQAINKQYIRNKGKKPESIVREMWQSEALVMSDTSVNWAKSSPWTLDTHHKYTHNQDVNWKQARLIGIH